MTPLSTIAKIYVLGMAAAFPAGLMYFFLLFFLTGFCDKPLHRIRAADFIFNFVPAVMGAAALAALSSLAWPISLPAIFLGFGRLLKRVSRMAAEARAAGIEEDRWPVSVQKPPAGSPGIEFPAGTAGRRAACPVCMGELSGEVRICPSCGAAHHLECWNFHGGCAMFGCKPSV